MSHRPAWQFVAIFQLHANQSYVTIKEKKNSNPYSIWHELFKIIVITEKKEGKKRYKKNIENLKFCKYFLSFFLLFFFIFRETIPRSKARSSVYRVISGREIGQRRCGRSWLPYKSDCGQGASQLLVLNHFNRCCARDGFKDRVILPLVPFRTEWLHFLHLLLRTILIT